MVNSVVTFGGPTGPSKAKRVIARKMDTKNLSFLMIEEDEDKSVSSGYKRELQTPNFISDSFRWLSNDYVQASPLPSYLHRKPFLVLLRLRI